jgi:hypothetical protein
MAQIKIDNITITHSYLGSSIVITKDYHNGEELETISIDEKILAVVIEALKQVIEK